MFVSDIAVFVLKRGVKLQPTNQYVMHEVAITRPDGEMWLAATTLPHVYFDVCTEICQWC